MRSVRPEGAAGTNDNVETIGKRKPTGAVEFAIRNKGVPRRQEALGLLEQSPLAQQRPALGQRRG